MRTKKIKIIWAVISMLLLAGPASAKLSESAMRLKILNFYNEYIRLVQSTDSDSEEKCIKLIRNNCTSSYASQIENDAKYGMGLDYICCEYVDDIDTTHPLSVIKEDNGSNYAVIFYANCLQKDGKVCNLRIQLRVTIVNDLISKVVDPDPTQRDSKTGRSSIILPNRNSGERSYQRNNSDGSGVNYRGRR